MYWLPVQQLNNPLTIPLTRRCTKLTKLMQLCN